MYKERVFKKLTEARKSMDKIKLNFPDKLDDFLKMDLERDGIYKNIEFVIQTIVDICSILIKEFDLGIPGEEADIFEELEKNKILEKKVINKIIKMKGFRNFLVHRYGKIDDKIAYNDIKNGLKDFDEIFEAIEKVVEK